MSRLNSVTILNIEQVRALNARVYETLGSKDKSIAILGWKDEHHDGFTKALSRGKKVFFYDNPPQSFFGSVDLVLFARDFSDAIVDEVRTTKKIHPGIIAVEQIKSILRSCKDLLDLREPTISSTSGQIGVALAPLRPQSTHTFDEKLAELRAALSVKAHKNKEHPGYVSRFVLDSLRHRYRIDEKPDELIRRGLIVARNGFYALDERALVKTSDSVSVPSNIIEQVAVLIAKKNKLLAEREGIEGRISEENKRLRMVLEELAKIQRIEVDLAQLANPAE